MLTAPPRLHLRSVSRASSQHVHHHGLSGDSVGGVARTWPLLPRGARRARALHCSTEDGHSAAAQTSPVHQSTHEGMREAPGWEPGRTVTVETTGGEVYQGVVVRFLPPGQLLVELQQQVREAQQQQVMESQQQQVMKSQWMRELVALPWEPSLRTVAATILLHAWSGSRTRRRRAGVFRTPSSDYFSKLAQAGDSRLQQVTGSMGVELVELGKEADAVLARRSWVQLETLEDLEIDVYNMRSWIAPHLEVLEGVCPWECRILQAYEDFKRAFPKGFR